MKTGIPMVLIAGGTFSMGGPTDSVTDDGASRPPVEVRLDPYYIAKYETTQAQWENAIGSIPVALREHVLSHNGALALQVPEGKWAPCTGFSWTELEAFLEKVDARLPTEAEWECACYGRTRPTAYPSSQPDRVLVDVRWTAANDLGLHGMLDNAAELCSDLWLSTPGSRTLRGYYWPWWRCAYDPRYQAIHVGFRIAKDP